MSALTFRRSLALLVGMTAVSAAGLAALEAAWGGRSEHASMRSTRLAAAAFGDVTRRTFVFGLNLRVLLAQEIDRDVALLRLQRARREGSVVATALARADVRAAERVGAANRKLFRLPPGERGAAAEAAAVERVVAAAERQLEAAEDEAAEAERYGRRQTRTVFGLTLAAMAGALLGLAGMVGAGRPGRIALSAGAVALLAAVFAGASSFL